MRLDDFLNTNAAIKSFEKGQSVFAEGQEADAAYYIIEGQVEIFKDDGGRLSGLAMLGPGEIFGEMALLRFDKYTLSAKATAALKVHVITPEILQAQIRETHPLIKAILDMLMDRIRDVNEVLIDHDRVNRA
jgi:CRP/FNR family cyclic AMP-dependent transcriptional regulator